MIIERGCVQTFPGHWNRAAGLHFQDRAVVSSTIRVSRVILPALFPLTQIGGGNAPVYETLHAFIFLFNDGLSSRRHIHIRRHIYRGRRPWNIFFDCPCPRTLPWHQIVNVTAAPALRFPHVQQPLVVKRRHVCIIAPLLRLLFGIRGPPAVLIPSCAIGRYPTL